MKSLSVILGLATVFLCKEFNAAQPFTFTNSETAVQDTESDIKLIREQYQKINSLKLQAQKFSYETKSCVEGGEITYYSFQGKIVKVTEKGAMNDAVWKKEYYYKDGKVFFCLENLQWGSAAGPTKTTVYRFYIKNGKSIREMSDQKIEDLKEKASENIALADALLKVKNSRNFSSVYDRFCDK
ncbi:hypothetical protein MKJ01_11630 [Chryseobacterium sp. SSA4.19]|uniref:hypothetical protein n=1 Tax=Chryseobacterium sp. SSA4.19 TaxID=2919915 RepID=UPI001F4E30C3|nr:hypothetical protein [Chryseobacterium sp. SSA4.19]MCJ8154412.1 hypothetical protein [Chryseobacterium sp. SSA4.19]